jgi:hypothetical protein
MTTENQGSKDHGGPEAFDIYEENEEEGNQISRTYKGFVKRKPFSYRWLAPAISLCCYSRPEWTY